MLVYASTERDTKQAIEIIHASRDIGSLLKLMNSDAEKANINAFQHIVVVEIIRLENIGFGCVFGFAARVWTTLRRSSY